MNLKNILIFTLVIIFILFILLIAHNNKEDVKVNFKFIGVSQFTAPISGVIVASFLIGLLVAFIWSLISATMQSIKALTTKRKVKVQNQLTLLYQEGLHQMLLKNYPSAEMTFKKILRSDPKDLKTLTSMGNVLRLQSKNFEAEEYHLKALLLDDGYIPALEGLFTDYVKKEKWILAKNTAEKILASKDVDSQYYNKELVKILIAEENWENASKLQEEIIKKANRDDKKDEQALLLSLKYQLTASQIKNKKNLKDVDKTLKSIIDANDQFIPAYIKLAENYINKEDYANAFKILSEGYSKTKEPVFVQNIEDLFIETNQPDDAIAYFKNLTKQFPKEVLPIFTLGKLYYKFEMIEEARAIFDRLHAELDYSPTLEFYVAKTESREGNREKSVERLKNLVRKASILDITYACTHCGYHSSKWLDRCPQCGCWNCLELTPLNELNELEVKKITPPRIDY